MGNFMDTCIEREQTTEETQVVQQQQQQVQVEKESELQAASRVRIKLVMTKEELGWLLMQLQNKQGKKIQEILGEIEKGRSVKNVEIMGWKPSLESIIESPEVMEMDRLAMAP